MQIDDADLRALRAIAGGCRLEEGPGEEVRLAEPGGRRIRVGRGALRALADRGLIAAGARGLALTRTGADLLARSARPDDPFRAQHMEIETREVETPAGRGTVAVNLAESPLGQLMRRKGRDGRAYLTADEFDAGERLRADFTRARMLPRLGASWEQPVSSGRRAGAAADLSDGAIAARTRVERALDAVGPELAGILVDICCFLKGLELVERERGWPARSAKLLLKAALGALARHYRPPDRAPGRRGATLSWGADGYRPTIGPR